MNKQKISLMILKAVKAIKDKESTKAIVLLDMIFDEVNKHEQSKQN